MRRRGYWIDQVAAERQRSEYRTSDRFITQHTPIQTQKVSDLIGMLSSEFIITQNYKYGGEHNTANNNSTSTNQPCATKRKIGFFTGED